MKIIFDLDGTLALIDHRKHFIDKARPGGPDWRAFYAACVDDEPNEPVLAILHAFAEFVDPRSDDIQIWSGRSDEVRKQTVDWLEIWLGWQRDSIEQALRMREAGDFTVDHELKERWLRFEDPKPDLAFDDRDQVVAMWRRNGITCCQVAPGDF